MESLRGKETEKYPLSQWYLGALYALEVQNNPDRISQAAHSLRELVEKLQRVIQEMDVQGQSDFKGIRRSLKERFYKDKKRYDEKWKGKKIDGALDKTLRKFDGYLERNQQPTRRKQVETVISMLDPMAGQLDSRIRDAKRDELHKLLQELEDFTHHNSKPDINEFRKYLETLEGMIFDLLAPITAQDQNEIQSILELSNRSESDEERMLTLIERRGANFAFFFEKVGDASWIPVLREKGYFAQPSKAREIEDGRVIFPFWRPVLYLERISATDPSLVVDTILSFEDIENPRILYTISKIALKVEPIEQSLRLKEWVFKYLQSPDASSLKAELIPKLMNRWAGASTEATDAALQLMRKTIRFRADPESQSKQARHKADPESWPVPLYPRPYFDEWEYQEILVKGVRPLAEHEPYQIARILIDAVANMIRLRFHRDQLEKVGDNDFSTNWCKRVNEPAIYREPRVNLVNALSFACEKVYEKVPESVAALDQALRNQWWDIFKRIRQHLYALHLNEQSKPWIRELILAHPDYDKWEHHFEFQRMIRLACEHFGADLLTEAERTQIFEAILSGPSKQSFRDRTGDQFTEELFEGRRRYFHKMQLNPFASVLFGEYRNYFQKLITEEEKPVTDDDYAPYKSEGAKWIGRRSPKPTDELKEMSDEALLSFLNEWDNVGRDPEEWWTEITLEALAEAFREIFQESIIADESRLRFWIENKHRIDRPIYVRAMLSAIQEHVKLKQFDRLDDWFDLCEWILSHTDQPKEAGVNRSDESKAHPDWQSSRREVGDFVDMCVKQEVDVPISERDRLTSLLDKLCTQYDEGLDESEPVLLNLDDQLTEAINNTRSRALESLVDLGYWVHRQEDDQADTPEVFTILEKRIGLESERPLALPEYALLGMQYSNICVLNRDWAEQHKSDFFPQDDLRIWTEAFGNFLIYNRPHRMTIDILRDEIKFGIEKIGELHADSNRELADTLGEHLFTYYVWEVYPLKGENSLLEKFYEKTREDKGRWSHLFDHVGRSLKNSGRELEEDLRVRIIAFFDWRFEAKEPSELSMFTFWLAAECLDAEWRLKSYSKILDVCSSDGVRTYTQLESLLEMLEENTALVVECLAKLTELAIKSGKNTYIHHIDQARPILEAGLKSKDSVVKENAERTHENLLKGGHFDLLNLND